MTNLQRVPQQVEVPIVAPSSRFFCARCLGDRCCARLLTLSRLAVRAFLQVLQWTQDWGRARALAWRVACIYADEFGKLTEPLPGVREWLTALSNQNVPCGLVSSMDRPVQVDQGARCHRWADPSHYQADQESWCRRCTEPSWCK
jgi:hypothetical protein